MNHLIAVALCTYNGEKFLRKQLESILNQSKKVDELVVFDDCSTDSTLDILHEFKLKAPFDVHIHQNEQNVGSSKNFENCISSCKGEVIFLCDQDDLWHNDKVEKQIAYFQQNPQKDAVFSNAIMINQIGLPTGKTAFEQIEFVKDLQIKWNNGGSFDILLRGYVVTGATLAIRAKIVNEIFPVPNIIDELIHDGWISLWLSMNNRIGFLTDPLISYREHESQQVGLKNKKQAVTLLDRITRNREVKLNRLKKKYNDSLALCTFLSNHSNVSSEVIEKLLQRTDHYAMRSSLSKNRLKRIWPVIVAGLKGNYKLQDGGKWWHPILGDILE